MRRSRIRRIFIVIGLEKDLHEVKFEAEEVAEAAEVSKHFDRVYRLIEDPKDDTTVVSAETIIKTIRMAVGDLRDNSLLLLYYAGHGFFQSGSTCLKTSEGQEIALEKEVFSQVKDARETDRETSRRSLDMGFVFSCCQEASTSLQPKPLACESLADDTVIKMYGCEPRSKVVDSRLLGSAFAYYLQYRPPPDLQSLFMRVCTDVRHLSVGHIQPLAVGVALTESNLGMINY